MSGTRLFRPWLLRRLFHLREPEAVALDPAAGSHRHPRRPPRGPFDERVELVVFAAGIDASWQRRHEVLVETATRAVGRQSVRLHGAHTCLHAGPQEFRGVVGRVAAQEREHGLKS
ncbi:MAG: hypothetical protein OXH70_09440 [Acidobacteria bacterium]|nr:hypothetical protein [Acidobacteriota bacterium]